MPQSLPVIRRTAAEILAAAVLQLYPDAKLIGGGLTPIGFTYAFVLPRSIDEKAIFPIASAVERIIAGDVPIQSREMMRENAVEFLHHHRQPYLAKAIANFPANIVSLLQIEEYFGCCQPPYLSSTQEAGACKILTITQEKEALDGDSKEVVVTYIEGTAFPEKKLLKEFLKKWGRAKKKDHQKLGPALDLVCQQEGVDPGCWSWLPKGETIKRILIDWWTGRHLAQGYQFLSTPGPLYAVNHARLFNAKGFSYEELPVKYAEIAQTQLPVSSHRLCGMLRSRLVTADYTHLFCEKNQGSKEIISSLLFFKKMIKLFDVDHRWYLVSSTQEGKRKTESQDVGLLAKALRESQIDYCHDPIQAAGEGPRIELRLQDSLGSEWRGPTIEISGLAGRMGLCYRGSDDGRHNPLMIGRCCFGTLERFFAILVEQYAGLFPLWLAPEQVRVIPIKEVHRRYAKEVSAQLQKRGVRVGIEEKHETVAAKVYAAEQAKIPYLVIVGDAEEKEGTIAIRTKQGRRRVESMEAFLTNFQRVMSASNAKFGDDHAI
ncbi:MAG: threonine--tRNA ligase [Waddliaceae bacterium]